MSAPENRGRYGKGQSGNPKGRPRKAREERPSAFAVILDQTIAVRDGSGAREFSAEEALQYRTYQDALKGSRIAQRSVFRMIAKRDAWLAEHAAPRRSPIADREEQPDHQGHAKAAMRLLGISGPGEAGYNRAQLEPWAVGAVLDRLGNRRLNLLELASIRVSTRDWISLDIHKYQDDGQ